MRYHNWEIELTEDGNDRPDRILVDGVEFSRERHAQAKGYNWRGSPGGNVLYFMAEDGRIRVIPQEVISRIDKADPGDPNSGYVVIGGQYRYHYYGVRKSLHAAKMLATENVEYWDNWQGWHTPLIYRLEDCEYKEGIPGDLYNGQTGYFPKWIGFGDRGEPYMYKDGKTWRLFREA